MIFIETALRGAYILEPERIVDERGFFARTFCRKEFEDHGLNPNLVQCNVSFNRESGTLRGMHYQLAPCAEAKLVRCTRGAVHDVLIDLRRDSPTFRCWIDVPLHAEHLRLLYIPEGLAHGFLTLCEDTEVSYQMSEFYNPDLARGVRWNDAAFAIAWPDAPRVISERDRNYPDFEP